MCTKKSVFVLQSIVLYSRIQDELYNITYHKRLRFNSFIILYTIFQLN